MNNLQLSGEGVLLLLVGLVGALLLVIILRWINRSCRLFTRGTVSFIVAFLLAFTVIDTLIILNEIKINQSSTREGALRRTVANTLTTWLTQGAEAAAQKLDTPEERQELLDSLRSVEKDVAMELARRNAQGEDLSSLNLVALQVDEHRHRSFPVIGHESLRFRALLDDGLGYIELKGEARVAGGERGQWTILGVRGAVERSWDSGSDRDLVQAFERANAFQDEEYRPVLGGGPRSWSLKRPAKR